MGRKSAPVVLVENTRVRQLPLFADTSLTDTDMIQSPSDRFHRWLMNISTLIQEYRAGELLGWNADLNTLLKQPSNMVLEGHVRKASEWTELQHELMMLHTAFTKMLLADQLSAVELFEVQNVTQLTPNEQKVMVPRVVEVLRASFPHPFLASAFDVAWSTIKARHVEPIAIYELKKVTVHRIPGQWIREDRNGDSTFAVTSLLKDRQDQCDTCGGFAWVPYHNCYFCNDAPCYHHGRCCPALRGQAASSSSRRPPASSSTKRPTGTLGF